MLLHVTFFFLSCCYENQDFPVWHLVCQVFFIWEGKDSKKRQLKMRNVQELAITGLVTNKGLGSISLLPSARRTVPWWIRPMFRVEQRGADGGLYHQHEKPGQWFITKKTKSTEDGCFFKKVLMMMMMIVMMKAGYGKLGSISITYN